MKSKVPSPQGSHAELLNLSSQLGSVTRAGRVLGFGWNRAQRQASEDEHAATVVEHTLPRYVETAVVTISLEQPSWGPVRITNELLRRGVDVTIHDVLHVWQLHDLKARDKRHKALIRSQEALHITPGGPTPARRMSTVKLLERLVVAAALMGMALAGLTFYTTFF